MTYDQVLQHFGTQVKIAAALEMTQGSVSAWEGIVPPFRQLQIERVTGGKLVADGDVFTRKAVRQVQQAA